MSTPTSFSIKSSIFDRARELVLDQEYLTFDNKDKIGVPPALIKTQDIVAFRFGIKWINGYSFVIGRIYCIDILSSSGEIIKLRLKSVYRVNLDQLSKKYSAIIQALYIIYFDNLVDKYLKMHTTSQEFSILGVIFNQDGIILNGNNYIHWEDIGTRSYNTYYAVFSKSNPNIYKAFEYLNDWNAGIMYSVSREILKGMNLYAEQP
ncbi:hypothetical protein [Paraflavitalea speifideaquila]|uniref:hypothetical protein n=1 Tax=Paraflavitalea speifideaquila TaxID=3076558 RepID=UPI0028EFA025|nr:hypothetical protein [Paraflavitalea speifideiaquila]